MGEKTEEVISDEKKAQLELEDKLRREQEAKNKLIQQQKIQQQKNQQKIVNKPEVKSNFNKTDTEFHRTLGSTFDLKFIVQFASLFLIIWLI